MNEQQLYKKTGNALLVLAAIMGIANGISILAYQKIYIYGLSAFVAFLFLGLQMTAKSKKV